MKRLNQASQAEHFDERMSSLLCQMAKYKIVSHLEDKILKSALFAEAITMIGNEEDDEIQTLKASLKPTPEN